MTGAGVDLCRKDSAGKRGRREGDAPWLGDRPLPFPLDDMEAGGHEGGVVTTTPPPGGKKTHLRP